MQEQTSHHPDDRSAETSTPMSDGDVRRLERKIRTGFDLNPVGFGLLSEEDRQNARNHTTAAEDFEERTGEHPVISPETAQDFGVPALGGTVEVTPIADTEVPAAEAPAVPGPELPTNPDR